MTNNPTIDGAARQALEQALLAMKRIYQAGHDSIVAAGGTCDSPDYMMAGDPTARELRALLDAPVIAQQDPVAIPDGYCIMPRRLTAENGAKALLLGEFKVTVTKECPECAERDDPNEYCEICDGGGEFGQSHTISWDQIKFIYSKAVEGLSALAVPSVPVQMDDLAAQAKELLREAYNEASPRLPYRTRQKIEQFFDALAASAFAADMPGSAVARAAIKTLEGKGYTYNGAELWKPPVGAAPDFNLIDDLRLQLAKERARSEWMLHNGGTINEWAIAWVPGKQKPLIEHLRDLINTAVSANEATRGEVTVDE